MGCKAKSTTRTLTLIDNMINNGLSTTEIHDSLNNEGITCSLRSVQRWIKSIRVDSSNLHENPTSEDGAASLANEQVCQLIRQHFNTMSSSDETLQTILQQEGFNMSLRTVQRRRLDMGLRYRDRNLNHQVLTYQHCLQLCRTAITEGSAHQFGRSLLYTHLRLAGYRVRSDHVWIALGEIWRAAGKLRLFHSKQSHNQEAVFPSPDFMWCVDGHDKLAIRYGIGVYGAIDTYSRYIVYFYVGTSHKRQLAVCKNHLRVIQHYNWCPRYMRSDRGGEVSMMADLQHTLYKDHLSAQSGG